MMKDDDGLEVPIPVAESVVPRHGLNKKIDRMLELLGDDPASILQDGADKKVKGKIKPYRIPSKIRKQAKKGIKKGKVLVFYARENRSFEPITTQVKNGMYWIDGAWRNADPKFLYFFNGKIPCYIQPQRTINPARIEVDGSVDVGNSADAERTVLNMLENGDVVGSGKMKGGGMKWIMIGIGLVVIIAIIAGGV